MKRINQLQITLLAILIFSPRIVANVVNWAQYENKDIDKGTYSYGYEIEDAETNNFQFKTERRNLDGSVIGSYGYLRADGGIHIVHYIADKNGYRARVENGVDLQEKDHSPEFINAIKWREIYKKQSVHEQRLRPFDKLSEYEKKIFLASRN
ncbi:hypothetical protein FQA39_LY03802 [Lamprigera yunnana]|nr:hypothetical protein FQA39_LY03802 [Lamprigera yunnana]